MARILLIDDSDYARSLTAKILKKGGHEILQAADGMKGFKMVTEQRPACVICDLLMPEMDGQKFLMALRASSLEIPVIMLTADVQDKTEDSCRKWGAVEVLHKPPREDALLAAVRRVLDGEVQP